MRHIALNWLDKLAIFSHKLFNGPELGRECFFPVDSFFPFSDLLLAEPSDSDIEELKESQRVYVTLGAALTSIVL